MPAVDLFNVFAGRIFRIPDFQRGYAWEEKQLVELWDDIDELVLENNQYRKHYTGTLFLEKIEPQEDEKWLKGTQFYHVIDGQQRLTTICILLFELIKKAKVGYSEIKKDALTAKFIFETNLSGKSKIYKFSYEPTGKNSTFLSHTIFEDSSIISDVVMNLYTKNLLNAKTFFAIKLEKLLPQQLEAIFEKVTTSLQFDVREIDNDLNVQAVFETLNNRGKALSTLEKLKNRLIFLNEKLPDDRVDQNTLRDKINTAWGKIYTALAQNPISPLNEDEFLSAHLSLYRRSKESVFSEKVAEEKVFQMFCNRAHLFDRDQSGEKEQPVTSEKIEDYIIKLSEAAPFWYAIHNPDRPILEKILVLNNGKDLKVFVLSLLHTRNEESITRILDKVEKLLFRTRVIWLFDERTMASWGHDLYIGKQNLTALEAQMDELLGTPIHNGNLIDTMNILFTYERGAKGFHRWGGLKYFLFEYEDNLKKKAGEKNSKVSLSDYDSTTIEHIIPQSFQEFWSTEVNKFLLGADSSNHEMSIKILLNTLGNLTILRDGKNSSVGNKSWQDKRARFRTGSYNEIDIAEKDIWDHAEIVDRGIKMLEFMETKVHGLKLSSVEKMKLLFYHDYAINQNDGNPS
ncbi:DUF262 domain-containing protein [Chryseolinea soli]|nr:DUF262 domain-containing protein [Chryseolinea soli]